MILELFTILILISFSLVGLGYYMDVDVLRILGFFFIFILGIILINGGGIEYHTGDSINQTGSQTTVIKDYATFDDWRINIFLAIVGGMGITLVLAQRKANSIRDD